MLIKHLFSCCLINLILISLAYSEEDHSPTMYVLQGKKFATKGRFEIGAFFFDTSFRNVLVKHPYAAHFAAGYHIVDCLQLETVGVYVFYHDETNLIKRVRALSLPTEDLPLPTEDLPLPELWQTKWQLGLNKRIFNFT
jgi:hypothetical protein